MLRDPRRQLTCGVASVLVLSCFVIQASSAPRSQAGTDGNAAQLVFQQDGRTYAVVDGNLYQLDQNRNRTFVGHLYDPDFFRKHYKVIGGVVYFRDNESGSLYPITRAFHDGFEGAASTDDLFAVTRWHSSTADPGRAGEAHNYYHLGNRVTLSHSVVHSGQAALRCSAVPSDSEASKASISKGVMYFVKGDDVYFSGRFLIEPTPSLYDGGGFTLFDLESTYLTGNPGMRLIIKANDSLAFELKFPKLQFRQDSGSEVRLPTGRWVTIDAHISLSDEDGRVRIWQDGQLVLDKRGRTLPLSDTVYDRFEVGISAIAQGALYSKVVHVDDVAISDVPIGSWALN